MTWMGTREGSSAGQAPGSAPVPVPAAVLRRPRLRGNLLFTVLLAFALLVGAVFMALVLLSSGAPDAIAIGVVLAALPVGPVVACYMWLDRYEPEPLALLGSAFAWGALVATAVAAVLESMDQYFVGTSQDWSAAIVAPTTEELAKGLFIVLLLWLRRHELDGILDGLVYAGLVGVGFAFTENILYLASAYMGDGILGTTGGIGAATGLFVVRGVFSPFAHPLFTAAIGIGVGIAVTTRVPAVRVAAPLAGYLCAVGLHALWNASAFFDGGSLFVLTYVFAMVPAFALLVALAVWARRREAAMLVTSLQDLAGRGVIRRADIPWLARLGGRRAARAYAGQTGGPHAERLMGQYQQEAVELAYLHHRYLRGTGPRDAVQRGAAMVQRLAALRPYVRFPHTAAPHDAPHAAPQHVRGRM
jgi:protease PrsW